MPPEEAPRGQEETIYAGTFLNPGLAFDPSSGEVYGIGEEVINHYNCYPCEELDLFGAGDLFGGASAVAVDGASHAVYVSDTTKNDILVFEDARPIVTTGQPAEVSESEITLTGQIEPAGRGEITECHFEYGFEETYGTIVPCTPNPEGHHFSGPTHVEAKITGLSAGTKDHYRLVAANSVASAHSQDKTFVTTQPPSIDGLKAEDLTATSAKLVATVNPNGLPTTYQFKYGPTTRLWSGGARTRRHD